MADVFDPVPVADPPVAGTLIAPTWYRWFDVVRTKLMAAVGLVASAHKASQSVAITTTTLYTPTRQGVYRVSWALQVTQAASVSSAVQLTLTFKVNGVTQTVTSTNLTGNLTTTRESGSLVFRTLVTADIAAIGYATTYSSVGGTAMVYALALVCESLLTT